MIKHMTISGLVALLMLPACWTGKDKQSVSVGLLLKQDSLYKIVSAESYEPNNLDDCVKLTPLDVESGFIHVSFGNQAENILKKFFKGSTNTVLLELDPQVLQLNGLEVRKEQNKPDGDFFPHIYGVQKIPAAAVVSVVKVYENSDGSWGIER